MDRRRTAEAPISRLARTISALGFLCGIAVSVSSCSSPPDNPPLGVSAPPPASSAVASSGAPSATGSSQSSKPTSPTTPTQSGGAEGASSASAAPCPIASASAIEAALGAAVTSQSTSSAGTSGLLCQIYLKKSNLRTAVTLYLSTTSAASLSTFKQAKRAALATGAVAIAGVGQDAYYDSNAFNLHFINGHYSGAVQIAGPSANSLRGNAEQVRSNIIKLAQSIAANQ